ncbi:hypothetical protein KAU11_02800 [Candidatus Babeliales bacterium]|nr:hypothetical protein [Candidatus Babeliales bacterium]
MSVFKNVFLGVNLFVLAVFCFRPLSSSTIDDDDRSAVQSALMLSQQQENLDEFNQKIQQRLRERINAGMSDEMALQAALIESYEDMKKKQDNVVDPGSLEAQAVEHATMLSEQQAEQDRIKRRNSHKTQNLKGDLTEDEAMQIAIANYLNELEDGIDSDIEPGS